MGPQKHRLAHGPLPLPGHVATPSPHHTTHSRAAGTCFSYVFPIWGTMMGVRGQFPIEPGFSGDKVPCAP